MGVNNTHRLCTLWANSVRPFLGGLPVGPTSPEDRERLIQALSLRKRWRQACRRSVSSKWPTPKALDSTQLTLIHYI